MTTSSSIASEQLITQLQWRYATKKFDPSRSIPREIWEHLETSLVLTPSSYGLQPWRFLIVTQPELKEALSLVSWKQRQPADCSHFVVFAAREYMDTDYVDAFLKRTADVRGIPVNTLAKFRDVLVQDVVTGPRGKIALEWATRQVYIALGQFMASCALLGVDACPMEGIVPEEYDRLLGLVGSGYRTVVACAAGYRAPDDKYAFTPKVRFPSDQVVKHLGAGQQAIEKS